jgi:proline iminopeptidase
MSQKIYHGKGETRESNIEYRYPHIDTIYFAVKLSYSIAQSVKDLESVISQLCPTTRSFHLFGHSYGGVLAYEFLSYCAATTRPSTQAFLPKSLILSNTPNNLGMANTEYDRLWNQNPFTFWNKHACRVGTPPPLQDALEHVGSVWGGMDAVTDYVAQPLAALAGTALPPTLVLSGGHDFAYKTSNEQAWKPLISSSSLTSVNFESCAHYPFYEDGPAYTQAIDDFLKKAEKV